ncbi:MAG: TonB-dependent receptor [Gammaproteobacteria bacterium]|nr:TonB-dependent receptor [Gammaproteobacteria bacterium]
MSHAQTIKLEPLEVTSTADTIHRVGDVVFEEIPGFVTFIPRGRFAVRFTSLEQLIENETGVQVRQSGGLGSFSSISLRGASSQQVMIYLDGLPLNEAAGGAVDLSQISLSEVQSIEIYRGIIPVNFASASIGGALNIRTLRTQGNNENSLYLGYGSFNTRQAGLLHLGGKSVWESVFSAQFVDADNDFPFDSDNGTPLNPNDDRSERRENAQFRQLSALFKLGRQFHSNLRFDALANVFDKVQGLPSVDNSSATTATLDTLNLNSTLSLTAKRIRGSSWNASMRASATRRREIFDDSKGQIGLGAQHSHDQTQRYGMHLFTERLSSSHTLSAGLDLSNEIYDSEDLTHRREDITAERKALEAAVQATLLPLDGNLLLTPALRVQTHWDSFEETVDEDAQNHLNPQVGARYRLNNGLMLKSNIARYVRLPSFYELFGDRGFVVGNTNLAVEKGLNIDAGVEFERVFSTGGVRELNLSLGYFYSKIDDLIALVFDARGVGRPVNIAQARIQGLELGGRLGFSSQSSVVLNATWQDPKNHSQISSFDGKRLPGRYETMVSLRLEQIVKRLKLYYQFRFESGLFFDSANLLAATDIREHNIGAETQMGPLRLALEARNLGDENFQKFNGFPTPGRSLFCKLTYGFKL